MTAQLSVVIVHWNTPALLDACLRSLAAELPRAELDVETLVVDNASPGDAFAHVLARYPWARALPMAENRGFAAGANAGLAAAAGAGMLLLNADVELEPGALRMLWDTLWIAPHVGLVAPLLLNTDGSLQSQGYRFPGLVNVALVFWPLQPRLVESPLNGRVRLGDGVTPIAIDYPLGAAMLVKRAALDAVGPLDEGFGMYSEEIDWARRFKAAGWTILLTPAARVTHHAGQATRQRPAAMRAAQWTSRARYFARWGTPWQRRLLPPLVRAGLARAERRADAAGRAANARVRAAFDELAGTCR
jgi:GT2 family glycosyltransferase